MGGIRALTRVHKVRKFTSTQENRKTHHLDAELRLVNLTAE